MLFGMRVLLVCFPTFRIAQTKIPCKYLLAGGFLKLSSVICHSACLSYGRYHHQLSQCDHG